LKPGYEVFFNVSDSAVEVTPKKTAEDFVKVSRNCSEARLPKKASPAAKGTKFKKLLLE
jgi:hypothetical protein